MSNGIYINENTFVSFAELQQKRADLTREIASRDVAWDYSAVVGLLPEIDPVLNKLGNGVEILESLEAWQAAEDDTNEKGLGLFSQDIEHVKMRDVVDAILNAPLYGMAPLELIWEPVEGRIALKDIQSKPARWFGFDATTNEPRFISQGNEDEGEKLPFAKFVIARNQPTYDCPSGKKLLSRCFWPITFKRGGLKFWVAFMEKYGSPFLLGHYPVGTNDQEQEKMLEMLARMVTTAVAVVPQGANVEVLNQGGGKGDSGHKQLIDAMNAEISKVIQGQTMTTEEAASGGYAQGKVHENTFSDYKDDDKALVLDTLSTIAGYWGTINGLPAPVPSFFEEDDPQLEFAERDAKLQGSGRIKLTAHYYKRRYNLTDEDFEIIEPSTPSAEDSQTKNFAEGQKEQHSHEQALDALAANVPSIDDLAEKAETLLDECADLEEYRDRLLELYSQMDINEYAGEIARALTLAELAGRFDGMHG